MADFCDNCAKEMGFPSSDFNIDEIFNNLELDEIESVFCEGCGMVGVGKDENGIMLLRTFQHNLLTKEEFQEKVWSLPSEKRLGV